MSTRNHPVMGPAEWLLLVTLSVLWGGTFFFAEVALDGGVRAQRRRPAGLTAAQD